MKQTFLVSILGLICCLSFALGQESQTKVGIGVSLNPTALFSSGSSSTLFLPVGLTNIYIPIMASANFRIEPEAGIYSESSENTSGSFSSKSSSTILRLGVGLFYVRSSETSFSSYVGPRLGILSTSSTSSSTGSSESKTSETNFFIGLCVGGEHSFSSHFSIGGEAQLNYISFGNPDRTPASTTPSTRSQSVFTNNALMFFRFYF
jgi:hypothetical protein